jgi:hypothetical protein
MHEIGTNALSALVRRASFLDRGYDLTLNWDRVIRSHRSNPALLECPQQSDLNRSVCGIQFIEKKNSVAGIPQTAQPTTLGSRKGTSLVSEELRQTERFIQGPHIQCNPGDHAAHADAG